MRGGIAMIATSFGLDDLIFAGAVRDRSLDSGRPAARIHDNVVEQPLGQALRLAAVGPVSVCDNRFASERSGPRAAEALAGTVMVLNLGGSSRLPAGTTLFDDNQTRLGPDGSSLTAQAIVTRDDLGYDANQSNALAGLAFLGSNPLFVNALLIAETLRATSSRFKEPPGTDNLPYISLLTISQRMNNTSLDQGDHCIFAAGNPVETLGNQVLHDLFCRQLQAPVEAASTTYLNRGYEALATGD